MSDWVFFLILIIASFVVQGFYSMLEMSCVSFNRVRLQYYVSQKNRRAKWLNALLHHPTLLFGTTLIIVNSAMQFGSECARRFYASLNMNPDWAPLTQVILVLIFAELAPMFAARRYPEDVSMFGAPILYFSSLIMRPVIYLLDIIFRFTNCLFGVKRVSALHLTREELQKAIEEREDILEQRFDPILANIFSLKAKRAKDLMDPLNRVKCISSGASVGELKILLGLEVVPFVPVYCRSKVNIVAIAYPRDLLRLADTTPLLPHCRVPWFITEKNSVLQIIKEFRLNNQSLAVILGDQGNAVGILTLDTVVDEIFGQRDDWVSCGKYAAEKHKILVDRAFPGDTLVEDVNRWFNINLPSKGDETLEDLMKSHLHSHLERGDSVRIDGFEFSIEESSLMAGRVILIRSIS